MRLIINADDCGLSPHVNSHINSALNAGKLTSTTIMANMNDFEGAIELYEKYNTSVSFGVHLNLTEGKPLIKSNVLLDFGLLQEINGDLSFNSTAINSFFYRRIPHKVEIELYKELKAQINRVLNAGVKASHLDSHHHIHTSFGLMRVINQLSKEHQLFKIRRIRNYVPHSISYYGRQIWAIMMKLQNSNLIMTNYFTEFDEFFGNLEMCKIKEFDTIELMVHPGHYLERYQQEENVLLDMSFPENFKLISYNEL